MNNISRKLDNAAKAFSLDEKNKSNIFRLSAILKEKIDSNILKLSILKTLEMYPSYKVKIKRGFFWDSLENNSKKPIIEEEKGIPCKSINFRKNNEYLFKVTYFHNKINLEVFHVLTDGLGATIFLKSILYNYLNLKYNLKTKDKKILKDTGFKQDEYLKKADKSLVTKTERTNAFSIKEKINTSNNKTYHCILDLQKFKSICKKYNVSITEYITTLYIYTIYKTVYDKSSNKDIVLTIPIDLRRHYNVTTFSNFFTCMKIQTNVVKNQNISFEKMLNQVHKNFKNKLTIDNIKKYLSRDVKLGTNIGIKFVPLYLKKKFMKYFGNIVNQKVTSTLSNIGSIKVEEQYRKYIDNIMVLVSTGKAQKVKCSICSYENNLTITINSCFINNNFENEFYKQLKKHVGKVKVIS